MAGLAYAGTDGAGWKLADAVRDGDRAGAIELLKQKADVNAPEPDGTTALHWAVRQDDGELVDRLIKAGANVKATNRYGVTRPVSGLRQRKRADDRETFGRGRGY